jgi:hypothetical protein
MEITTPLLKTIYERANQFAITKYGSEPDRLELNYDGQITARWIHYDRCGGVDENSEEISADDLIQDLDQVAEERRKRIEEERIKRDRETNERIRIQKELEKVERKRQYEELRKEFGN